MQNNVKRTGILGGTFNPVHVGHVRLALEVAEALDLDKVELMPCAVPPHKTDKELLPFALRVQLLRAAIAGIPTLTVSTLEAELPPPSYTWNLVQAWTQRHGHTPLFILGDEDFAALHTWFQGHELITITDFVVVSRSDSGSALFVQGLERLNSKATPCPIPGFPGRLSACLAPERQCTFLPLPRLDISASNVRKQWARGYNIRYLIPDAVLALMAVHQDTLKRCWQTTKTSPGSTENELSSLTPLIKP